MMFLPDEGYESGSSLSDDMHNSSSSDEGFDSRESAGSSALICAAIEATHSSGFKWIRPDEDESEIRQFADILATLSELPVDNRRQDGAANNTARGESVTVKSVESALKKKRRRTSPEQLRVLEAFFESNKMPSQATRQKLAENLGMSSRRVQIWFQNKRAKLKRTGKDCDSERDSLPGSPVHQIDESRYALFRLASDEMHRSAVVRPMQPFYGSPQQVHHAESFMSFYGQPIFV